MILTVIKNSLLAILIILILHVILKNEVYEDTEKMKRLPATNRIFDQDSKKDSKKDSESPSKVMSPSKDTYSKKDNNQKISEENNAYYEKECTNSLICSDFKLPEKKLDIDEMKELYDYVFEKHDTDQSLETVFNNDDKVIHVDMTELDKHINDISETQKDDNLLCSLEIIGIIENTDDVDGIDMFSQNHLFSKVI